MKLIPSHLIFIVLGVLFLTSSCVGVKIPASIGAESDQRRQAILDVLSEPKILSSSEKIKSHLKREANQLNFVSTVSGGGYRAGGFALGHLIALDSIKVFEDKSLFDELDFISSVSGGGIGVGAVLTALLNSRKCAQAGVDTKPLPLVQVLANPSYFNIDNMRSSWGFKFLKYAANPLILKKKINKTDLFYLDYYNDFLSLVDCDTFEKIRPLTLRDTENALDYGLPYHISNATISTSGHVLPFVSNVLNEMGVRCFASKGGKYAYVKDSGDVPYSIGIAASAAFPPLWPDIRVARPKNDSSENCEDLSFYHLTDGGQSDDNGYVTGLNVLSELGKYVQSDAHALLVSVDALGAKEGLLVDQATASNIFNTYLMRNHNLPRYSLKRDFRKDIVELKEKNRSLINSSIGNSRSLALHVSMEKTIQKGADISTFANALGITKSTLLKVMLEGMLQTYRSFMYGNKDVVDSELFSALHENSLNLLYQIMCGDNQVDVNGECHAIIGRSDLPKLNTQLTLDVAWSNLQETVNQLSDDSVEKPILEVAIRKKNIDWSQGLLFLNEMRRNYLTEVSRLSRVEIEKKELEFERKLRKVNKAISDKYQSDAEKLLSSTFGIFNEAGIDRSISVIKNISRQIKNDRFIEDFSDMDYKITQFQKKSAQVLDSPSSTRDLKQQLEQQISSIDRLYEAYATDEGRLEKNSLYIAFKKAALARIDITVCEIGIFSEITMMPDVHSNLMKKLSQECEIDTNKNAYIKREKLKRSVRLSANYSELVNERLDNLNTLLESASGLCASVQLVAKNTLRQLNLTREIEERDLTEDESELKKSSILVSTMACANFKFREHNGTKNQIYNFSGNAFNAIDVAHTDFTRKAEEYTRQYQKSVSDANLQFEKSIATIIGIEKTFLRKADGFLESKIENLSNYYKNPIEFRNSNNYASDISVVGDLKNQFNTLYCNEFSETVALNGGISADQKESLKDSCNHTQSAYVSNYIKLKQTCASTIDHPTKIQCQFIRFAECANDAIQTLPDLENRKEFSFKGSLVSSRAGSVTNSASYSDCNFY